MEPSKPALKIAVVIPCYRVKAHILQVATEALRYAQKVYAIDDKCPEESGAFLAQNLMDERLEIIYHSENGGVGAAVKSGYKRALEDGFDIVIKIDGDGQMDPSYIPTFVKYLGDGRADYVKGNRFYNPRSLRNMPTLRLLGNSALSLINKCVNGYWNIIDPTNGYTAIHATALSKLDLDLIENRYFFESDVLFRLGLIRAVVRDVSIPALYANEKSSLSIRKVLFEFPPKYLKRFLKRMGYQYYLRDFNIASIELIGGTILLLFGTVVGVVAWYKSVASGVYASTGTVMLSALPIILGFQLLLSFVNFDIQNTPKESLDRDV